MYEYLKGCVSTYTSQMLVLDINGIGYKIVVPQTSIAALALDIESATNTPKKEVLLYIEFIVREDAHILYGFTKEEERELFRLLTTVNGIGPKVALQIMNKGTSEDIITALARKDLTWLSSIQGIGKKTAERLCIELSDKASYLMQHTFSKSSLEASTTVPSSSCIIKSAINKKTTSISKAQDALIALGLSESEAKNCLKEALKHPNSDEELCDVSRLIQLALLYRKKSSSAHRSTL